MPLDADRIQKPVRKLRKLLKGFPKPPAPEQIHDFRTGARRLEATVEALGLESRGNERRMLRKLKTTQACGQDPGYGCGYRLRLRLAC
jgi:CHAD domain-containing protein